MYTVYISYRLTLYIIYIHTPTTIHVIEFVKVKGDEQEREAILISLIIRTFHTRTIVFCETKKETYRIYLILKLMEVPVAQLHGGYSIV